MARNSFFQFKKFRIVQDRCSMKVCTDAVLFGAIVPISNAQRVLDIGTGTGLLALMTAQKSETSEIFGIEIDPIAAAQAQENVAMSPWAQNIQILNLDARDYKADRGFDLIISNPPFYQNSLKKQKPELAHHADTLTLEQVIYIVDRNLAIQGSFALLLPPYEFSVFCEIAKKHNLYLNLQIEVFDESERPKLRDIGVFKRTDSGLSTQRISIKNTDGRYSDSFISLVKPFYLHL